jgi:hypothetical protein
MYPHWPKMYMLMAAATQGCHICRLFLSQLTIEEQEHLLKFERTNSQHGTIHLVFLSHRGGPQYIRMQFATPPEMSDSNNHIVIDLTMDQAESKY